MTAALVGFGLDYNYWDRYPGGLDDLCSRYRSRLSHVSIVAIPDLDGCRRFCDATAGLPRVHHLSNVAPANPGGPDWDRLRSQDALSGVMGAMWCGEDIGVWSLGPYAIPYFAPPPLDTGVVDELAERIVALQQQISIPFFAEVPSCTFVVGDMSLGGFFDRLVRVSGCGVVLDLSHVFSYALTRGAPPSEVLDSMPLDAVGEIHVAGGRVSAAHPSRYLDTHNDGLMSVVLDLLDQAVDRCPALRAVTFELGEAVTESVVSDGMDRIESILSSHRFEPNVAGCGKGVEPGELRATRPGE